MDILSLMQQRYTTKKYNSDVKINEERLEILKKILQLSPSSINSQPWSFIFIKDQGMKEKLAQYSFHNQEKVLDCSCVVVFNAIANVDYLEQHLTEKLPPFAINYFNNVVKLKPEHEILAWLQHQVYISLGVFLTACASMEIDATPMEGIDFEKYTETLDLTNYRTVFAVCIGKRDENDTNQPQITPKKRLDIENIISEI